MSRRERDVLKVMSLVLKGERTQLEAARLLGRSVRQVRRLQRRLEAHGDGAVVHGLRGRPSNHRSCAKLRKRALKRYRATYAGFGPTLACEKLASEHGLLVPRETFRQWLLGDALWSPKRERDPHRQRRERRTCFGEMVQADASEHDWLEGRGPRMVLMGMIDDATGRIVARFYPAETTEAYLDLLMRYARKHGRPLSWYCDRDSVFRAEKKEDRENRVPTQFSRALSELGIELILANSPQAKGRIERLWGTLQDRWVKELRLKNVTTIEAANALLEAKLIEAFNAKFAKTPASPNDAHRPIGKLDLEAILSVQEKRRVANDYTIRFRNVTYQLLPPAWPGLRKGQVIVEQRLDGSMKVRFGEKYLEWKRIEKAEAIGDPADSGAPPPNPRSLTHEPIPVVKKNDLNGSPSRSSTVHRAGGRSGRTPALPCPPADKTSGKSKRPWRPASTHPWRGKAVA